MVRSEVGGVVFTRNPVDGLDETIVEAVAGPSSQVLAETGLVVTDVVADLEDQILSGAEPSLVA